MSTVAAKRLGSHRRRHQQGSILLEAMVAIVIMATGLLGLASLQARVINSGSSAYYRGIASDIAADLADRVAANSSPYMALNGGVTGVTVGPDYSAITCTGTTVSGSTATTAPACGATGDAGTTLVADNDLTAFYDAIQQLPGGKGAIAKTTDGLIYTVTITWNDNNQAASGDTAAATANFVTTFLKPI